MIFVFRQTQRKPLGAQIVVQQQDDRRDEAPQRLHVPLGDVRPGGRYQTTVQSVSTGGAAQRFGVPADWRST